MKLTAEREAILQPLQAVIGVVERRQTMPILANVLLSAQDGVLSLTATDLDVELVATSPVNIQQPGEITVPGRKLLDIFRALPEQASVNLALSGSRVTVKAGRSRFTLSSLPASEFPVVEEVSAQQTISIAQSELRKLLERTHFSMAQQDVRYYLNGMLLECEGARLRTVATDGHRLALCETTLESKLKPAQVIIPRKGVLELMGLLKGEGAVDLSIGTNNVRAQIGEIRFTSKLIDGRFPDYARVIPAESPNVIVADRDLLRQALQRTSILANEKYRGIRLTIKGNLLQIQAHNPEQEEAEEEVEVKYSGEELELGFNVKYLLEALDAVEGPEVEVGLTDSNSSCLIRAPGTTNCKYVVMPMRL